MKEPRKSSSALPESADTSSMNHNGVTYGCTQCERTSSVIIEGVHYCSSHALAVTAERLIGQNLIVDLRTREPVLDLVGKESPSLDPRAIAFAI